MLYTCVVIMVEYIPRGILLAIINGSCNDDGSPLVVLRLLEISTGV